MYLYNHLYLYISEEGASRKQRGSNQESAASGVVCMSRSPMEVEEMSESKKRKIGEEDRAKDVAFEDDDEEKKVEEFFALIRSIREARDYLTNGSDAPPKKKSKMEEGKLKSAWKPTFRREDFIQDAHLPKAPSTEAALSPASASASRDLKQGSDHKESLDLKLSL